MKRINGINAVFAVATTALISVLWQAGYGQCCLGGGRYGRYENWPTNNDWDELLMLITGKYGKHGWGWQSLDSYAYSSLGDYPNGLKQSSTPWESSGGSSGGSNNGLYSSYQGSSGIGGGSNSLSDHSYSPGGGSTGVSKLRAEKFKAALNNYFKSQPQAIRGGGWSGGGGGVGGGSSGGGFVGESFIDSPRPGPPYDDSPKPGPPYEDNIGGGGPAFGPPYETGGNWPGLGGSRDEGPLPPSGNDHHQSSWPLPQGPPPSGPHDDDHPHSSPYNSHTNSHGNPFISKEHSGAGGGGGSNQFQSDYDTFGKKRRRQGRRRSHTSASTPAQQQRPQHQSLTQARPPPQRQRTRQAGLRTRPIADPSSSTSGKTPFKFPPYPGNRGAISRKQRRMGPPMSIRRRRLNTSFGGYKVDFSKFRFG